MQDLIFYFPCSLCIADITGRGKCFQNGSICQITQQISGKLWLMYEYLNKLHVCNWCMWKIQNKMEYNVWIIWKTSIYGMGSHINIIKQCLSFGDNWKLCVYKQVLMSPSLCNRPSLGMTLIIELYPVFFTDSIHSGKKISDWEYITMPPGFHGFRRSTRIMYLSILMFSKNFYWSFIGLFYTVKVPLCTK